MVLMLGAENDDAGLAGRMRRKQIPDLPIHHSQKEARRYNATSDDQDRDDSYDQKGILQRLKCSSRASESDQRQADMDNSFPAFHFAYPWVEPEKPKPPSLLQRMRRKTTD
jgi:hypothetical protein